MFSNKDKGSGSKASEEKQDKLVMLDIIRRMGELAREVNIKSLKGFEATLTVETISNFGDETSRSKKNSVTHFIQAATQLQTELGIVENPIIQESKTGLPLRAQSRRQVSPQYYDQLMLDQPKMERMMKLYADMAEFMGQHRDLAVGISLDKVKKGLISILYGPNHKEEHELSDLLQQFREKHLPGSVKRPGKS